jgi:alcohol dehydrogenase class IV
MAVSRYTISAPQTINFGVGCLDSIGEESRKLGAKRGLIVTDPIVCKLGVSEQIGLQLSRVGISVEVFAESEPEPTFPTLNTVAERLRRDSFDLLIGVGGGSSLDTAKGLSVLCAHGGRGQDYIGVGKVPGPGIDMILVPTTAGTGSEVTNIAIFGDPDQELKLGLVSPYLLARVAVVDPVLTYTCPPKVTATAGIDALVHAVECYTSVRANAYTDALALAAVKLIVKSLKTAVHDGSNQAARNQMAEGSLLAGIAFGNAGVAAVHALAYPLGARFHVPHGLANGVLLPYVLECNLPAALDKYACMAEALGEHTHGLPAREAAEYGLGVIRTLCKDIGIPERLRDLGVPEAALPEMAVATMGVTRLLANNPKQLTLDDVLSIWKSAW